MKDLLNQPLAFAHGRALPNRIGKAAMSERLAASGGAPSEGLVRLYQQWAQGGSGVLITGNVMIDSNATAEPGNVVVEDERHLEALKAWAQSTGDVPIWMQINHPGRQSPRTISKRPVAPSEVAVKGMMGAFAKPRALETHEIQEIIERFARTAAIAKKAGFDGIQIHGAHGYLVSQFLSPLTNLRSDEWGGSPENRRRFLVEIIKATRAAVGNDFTLTVKLNSADFQRGGFDENESMDVVEAIEAEGIDLLEISGGTYEAAAMFEGPRQRASTRAREAYFLTYAEKVRKRTQLPLMVTGGFRSKTGMIDALDSRAVDLIGMARPLAAEPDLPSRLLDGHADSAQKVDLTTGIRLIDSVTQASWYQQQIRHMAQGKTPDMDYGRVRSFLDYFRTPKRQTEASTAKTSLNAVSRTHHVQTLRPAD